MKHLMVIFALVLSSSAYCFKAIKAEQYNEDLSQGVSLSQIGSVKFISDIEPGDSVSFDLNISYPGAYEIIYVVSNQDNQSQFSVTKDGTLSKAHTDLSVPITNSKNEWTIAQSATHFDAGDHSITIRALKGKWSLNKVYIINSQERLNAKDLNGSPKVVGDQTSFYFSGLNVNIEDIFCKKIEFNAGVGTSDDCFNNRPKSMISVIREKQTFKPFIKKKWEYLGGLQLDIANSDADDEGKMVICSVSMSKDCGLPCPGGRKYGDKWTQAYRWGTQSWVCGKGQEAQFLSASCKVGYSKVEKAGQTVCEPAGCGGSVFHGGTTIRDSDHGKVTFKCNYGSLTFQSISCDTHYTISKHNRTRCVRSCGNGYQLGDEKDFERLNWPNAPGNRHVGYRIRTCGEDGRWKDYGHIRCNLSHGYGSSKGRKGKDPHDGKFFCQPLDCGSFGSHGTIKDLPGYQYKNVVTLPPQKFSLINRCIYKRKICQYGIIYTQTGIFDQQYALYESSSQRICWSSSSRRKASWSY